MPGDIDGVLLRNDSLLYLEAKSGVNLEWHFTNNYPQARVFRTQYRKGDGVLLVGFTGRGGGRKLTAGLLLHQRLKGVGREVRHEGAAYWAVGVRLSTWDELGGLVAVWESLVD